MSGFGRMWVRITEKFPRTGEAYSKMFLARFLIDQSWIVPEDYIGGIAHIRRREGLLGLCPLVQSPQ